MGNGVTVNSVVMHLMMDDEVHDGSTDDGDVDHVNISWSRRQSPWSSPRFRFMNPKP